MAHLTCFHGIKILDSENNLDLVKAMAAYLNSKYCHELISLEKRRLGGGLSKLEPRDVEKIPSPDWRSVSAGTIKKLASTFDSFLEGRVSEGDLNLQVITDLIL